MDSFGKIPDGFLKVNTFWMGDFKQCIEINALNGTWKGKYAYVGPPVDRIVEMLDPNKAKVLIVIWIYINDSNVNQLII